MNQARCDELVRDQQLNHVSLLVESMFEKAQVLAEDVREMRDAADMYEIDLKDDLQISVGKLERLFICELEHAVDACELKANDLSTLQELCEALHISEGRAAKMLQETVMKRVSGGVLQAAALLRQDAHTSAVEELERVLKFSQLALVQAEVPSVTKAERSELYMLYQAAVLGPGGARADQQRRLEILGKVLSLSGSVHAA